MGNSSLHSIRWLATPFAAVAAFLACRELFSLLISIVKPTMFPYLVLWAVNDWCATAFAILTAVEVAPIKKGKVAVIFGVILSVWHSVLLFTAPRHPIALSYSHETIVLTALGGFVIAGYLALKTLKVQDVHIHGDELVQVMMQQIAESRAMLDHEHPSDTIDFAFDSLPAEEEEEERPQPKSVTRDMLLLERELRYIGLERTAFISAIRFAITVERDAGYPNCRGENLLFHQIVLDSAMRLSVMPQTESFWKPIAARFRNYESLVEAERSSLLQQTEAQLPVEREPELEPVTQIEPELEREPAVSAA